MKKILFLLIASLMSTALLAVDDVENASAQDIKAKKGDDTAIKGKSQGLGYDLKFGDDKDANIHFWGLTRFYAYPADSETKLVMPYFRFYIDAIKNSQWSLHARLDYGQWVKGQYFKINNEKPSDKLSGAPTVYYARAYMTYKHDQNLQIHAGRMLNQAIKYDVFDKFTAFDYNTGAIPTDTHNYTDSSYQSGEGLAAEYELGNFHAKATITYTPGTNTTEQFFYSAFAEHKIELAKDTRIEYGMGASTTSNNTADPQYVEVTPDVGFFYGDFYILDQMMIRDLVAMRDSAASVKVSDYDLLVRNHLEVGKTFNIMGKDTIFDSYLSTTKYDSDSVSNLGLEAELKVTDSLQVLINTEYPNITNSKIEMPHQKDGIQRLNYYAYVNYYF